VTSNKLQITNKKFRNVIFIIPIRGFENREECDLLKNFPAHAEAYQA
jgi:hypothetical protein